MFSKNFCLKLVTALAVLLQVVPAPLARAAYLPSADSMTICGVTLTLSRVKVLYAKVNTATRFTTFREANGTAGYTPSGSLTYKVYAMVALNPTGTVNNTPRLLYGDTDVGLNAAGAPTTPIYLAGDATNFVNTARAWFSTANSPTMPAPRDFCVPIDFTLPNGKYLAAYASEGSDSNTIVYGYEQ